jgi:hypothetical protein
MTTTEILTAAEARSIEDQLADIQLFLDEYDHAFWDLDKPETRVLPAGGR